MADARFRNWGMQPWKVHSDEREYLYRANAECKWTRRGNTLSPVSRQDQYCSSLLELPGRKEGVKEKERDPLLNHQFSPLQSQWCLPSILQWGCSLWPRGPHQVRCVQNLGLWLDLTQPPALSWATTTTECDPVYHVPYIHSLVKAFPKSRFFLLNSLLRLQPTCSSHCISFL